MNDLAYHSDCLALLQYRWAVWYVRVGGDRPMEGVPGATADPASQHRLTGAK